MSSISKPFLDLTTPEAVNFTVSDLISHLQWTCFSDDFTLAVNILSAREDKATKDQNLLEEKRNALEDELKSCKEENVELREQMAKAKLEYESCLLELRDQMERDKRAAEAQARDDKLKKDYNLLKQKHTALLSSYLQIQEELKSCKKENAELRKQMMRLKEENMKQELNLCRADHAELESTKKENVELREQLLRAKDDYESGIMELRGEMKGMESDKRKADALVELYRKRYKDLIERILKLEDDAKVLMSDLPRAKEEVRGTSTLYNASSMHDQNEEMQGQLTEEMASISKEKKKDNPSNSQTETGMPVKTESKIDLETEAVSKTQPLSETININNNMVSPNNGKESTRVVVEIIDSDDEQLMGVKASASKLKRKGVSSSGGVDGDGSKPYRDSVGGETKPPLKKLCGSQCPTSPITSPMNNIETPGTSSKQNSGVLRLCEGKIRSALTSDQLFSQINNFARVDSSSDDSDDDNWKTETHMIKALEKDAQLCMKAVCALYREKAFKVSELPNTQSHEKSIALRGTSLAQFLVNGDSRAKLKKSIVDLQKKDEQGLNDCKRIAKLYSKKLFEIYKKDNDGFHPPFF